MKVHDLAKYVILGYKLNGKVELSFILCSFTTM
jgi:hypothetical protein